MHSLHTLELTFIILISIVLNVKAQQGFPKSFSHKFGPILKKLGFPKRPFLQKYGPITKKLLRPEMESELSPSFVGETTNFPLGNNDVKWPRMFGSTFFPGGGGIEKPIGGSGFNPGSEGIGPIFPPFAPPPFVSPPFGQGEIMQLPGPNFPPFGQGSTGSIYPPFAPSPFGPSSFGQVGPLLDSIGHGGYSKGWTLPDGWIPVPEDPNDPFFFTFLPCTPPKPWPPGATAVPGGTMWPGYSNPGCGKSQALSKTLVPPFELYGNSKQPGIPFIPGWTLPGGWIPKPEDPNEPSHFTFLPCSPPKPWPPGTTAVPGGTMWPGYSNPGC